MDHPRRDVELVTPLERRTPLRASRRHEWLPDLTDNRGFTEYVCGRCDSVKTQPPGAGPPDPDCFPCTGLKRSRLSPVSQNNSGRDHQRDEAYRDFVRRQPCVSCGSEPPSDPHHVRSRGAGFGDWLPDGTGNLAALCRSCHRELDDVNSGKKTFQERHDVDLDREASELGARFQEREAA